MLYVISSNRRISDVTLLTKIARWCNCLRQCATGLKVAGSITDGGNNPSGRSVALGLSKPLTEMRIRDVPWGWGGKSGRCVGLTTLPLPCVVGCLEVLEASSSWNCEDLTRLVKDYLRRNTAETRTHVAGSDPSEDGEECNGE